MIVDMDDLESVKYGRYLATQPFRPGHAVFQFDNLKLRMMERTAPRRYGRVVVCSEADRRFFSGRARRKTLVVPNGVSSDLLARPRAEDMEATLAYVGTMSYEPNVDACVWFVREIFPDVVARVPHVRLYLVGNDQRQRLAALHDGARVIVTGRVRDVTPYVAQATLSVVPLRVGGGTRIKILESLALGTPVVSTTVGAEGLDVVPGRHIRLADTPRDFAEAVVSLMRDPEARRAMSAAGRSLVAERYTWETIGASLKAELEGWLQERERGLSRAVPRSVPGQAAWK
jgi:glycosyltransferase involved in cell wall biosynthesis